MENSPIKISHDRLVRLKLIEDNQQQNLNQHQVRYFIYEIDDNRWQNVNPEGENEYDLQSIEQKPALLPIGIIKVDKSSNTFSFEGDLTVTQKDQEAIFRSLN